MEKEKKVSLAYYGFVLLLLTFIFLFANGVFDPTIEAGQHWREYYNIDNPFEEMVVYDYFIIDVKDDYVLFVQKCPSYIDTMSRNVRYFHYGKELISELE